MATVHDEETCLELRRESLRLGVLIGSAVMLIIALAAGSYLASCQERSFASTFTLLQAQHRLALEVERKRVARYAEIDALATAMDAARDNLR